MTSPFIGFVLTALYIYPWLKRDKVLPLQRRALPGTLQKHQLTTEAILLVSMACILKIGFIVYCVTAGETLVYIAGGIWAIVLFKDLLVLRRLLRDKNWFNDQFEKLKSRAAKTKERLRSVLAQPSPVPGFG